MTTFNFRSQSRQDGQTPGPRPGREDHAPVSPWGQAQNLQGSGSFSQGLWAPAPASAPAPPATLRGQAAVWDRHRDTTLSLLAGSSLEIYKQE